MKIKSNLLKGFFVASVVFLIGFHVYNNYKKDRIPEGMVLVSQSTVDSLRAYIAIADSLEILANMVPDTTIVHDTIYLDTMQIVETTPVPQVQNDTNFYQDSLKVKGKVDVAISFKVDGKLTTPIKWEYKPIIQKFEIIVEKPVPYPVIKTVNVDVPKYYTGHYLSLAIGGNDKMFTFGMDYDFVKKNNIYGLQYRRYGDINVYGVKVGVNLATLFKK